MNCTEILLFESKELSPILERVENSNFSQLQKRPWLHFGLAAYKSGLKPNAMG